MNGWNLMAAPKLVLRPVLLTLLAVTALALPGRPVDAQSRRQPMTSYDDFGPSPDDYRSSPSGIEPFRSSTGTSHRAYRGDLNRRSRDPAEDEWDRQFQDIGSWTPQRSNWPSFDDWSSPFDRRDTRPMNPGRSYDRNDDFNVDPSRYERPLPTNTRPVPVQPTKPAEPTLSEKIQQRYADPKVVRMLQQMTPASGEALFAEVSQYIDQRHVQPTSYQQRVASGLEHLALALQMPSFQQAAGLQDSRGVSMAIQQLRQLNGQAQVQDMNGAVMVMRQAGQIASQTAGINPAAASLAFVYGSLETLDKFSMLIAPEKSGGPSVGIESQMVGIGVEIEAHAQGLKILKALAGGPAAEATLQRGDVITAVNGQSIAGMSLQEAAEMIAGPSGSQIQLQLRRDNMIGDVTLVRRSFDVHSVAEVRMEDNGVGYIKLDQFSQTSAQELDKALWSLHQQGMQSLVFDLRGNPGGLLTTAIEISDRFLPGGTIVSTRGRTQNDNSQEVAQKANTWKTPLVVLVDHNSASASEIFAAAIQENGRGVIVGEKSYGKGTVQTLFPLKSVSSALRLTTAKFYSPEGREMAGAGVTPDIPVSTTRSAREGDDPALKAAIEAARDPRVQNMAEQMGRSALRVIRVAI